MKRFTIGEKNNYIGLSTGVYIAGISAFDCSDGSCYFVMKASGVDPVKRRLDDGTKFSPMTNSGGTWTANASTTDGKDWVCWSIKLS